uniref:Lecithin retinol acyltransferase-like n=2 Tax=Gouania willdenowi TaxID=441366 RepID=A0A8C5NCY7_GOUWI
MWLLTLLALIFSTSSSSEQRRKQEEEEEEEGQRESNYDLIFIRGDLLQVHRTFYTHFGIYLGGGRVAHLIPDVMLVISNDPIRIQQVVTNTRLILGALLKTASVRVDQVEAFAYGAQIHINAMDKMCSCNALPGEEVALRAERLQGSVCFSPLWFNCEHYAMFCRYNTAVSFQSFQFCKRMRKLLLNRLVSMVTAVMAVLMLMYLRLFSVGSALLAATPSFLIWMAA